MEEEAPEVIEDVYRLEDEASNLVDIKKNEKPEAA